MCVYGGTRGGEALCDHAGCARAGCGGRGGVEHLPAHVYEQPAEREDARDHELKQLRTYSSARYYTDDEILDILTKGAR